MCTTCSNITSLCSFPTRRTLVFRRIIIINSNQLTKQQTNHASKEQSMGRLTTHLWYFGFSATQYTEQKRQNEVETSWNVMAYAQKPDFVFRRNGRIHLNRRGRQFSRLLAAEVCASAVVMVVMQDAPCSDVKWRGKWRMEWVASTRYTTSEHGVSRITTITTANAHASAASSRLNWHPRRFKCTGPFRRKTKSGFCESAITFQTQSTTGKTNSKFLNTNVT
jgi:hypothetical protein